jgi:hypothetical protein
MASKRKTITGVLDTGTASQVEVVRKAFETSIKKYGGVPFKGTKGAVIGMVKRVYVDEATGYLMGEIELDPHADEAEVKLLRYGLLPSATVEKKKGGRKKA